MTPLMRFLFLLIAVALVGCNDSSTEPINNEQPATVSFSIRWPTPPPEDPDESRSVERHTLKFGDCPVVKVQCKVYGDNGKELTSHTWDCAKRRGNMDDIPAGTNRQFIVFGLDENDRILYRGQADRSYDLISGQEHHIGRIDPTPFVPLKSADGPKINVLNPTIEWNPVDGAVEYRIIVSENSDFANPIIDEYTHEESYKLAGLTQTKTYYMQVNAVDEFNNEGMVSDSYTVDAIIMPDTGQTQSYTDTKGEDSDYDINPPMYTKLDKDGRAMEADATSWAMVRDERTGLIWEVKTDDDTIHDKDDSYLWQDSQDKFIVELNELEFGGYKNWRLPTIKELSTLKNYDNVAPVIDPDYFPNTQPAGYWSSNVPFHTDTLARIVWMEYGNSGYIERSKSGHVRAVYSGPNNDIVIPDFEDHGNGMVTDKRTGLMWQKEFDKEPRNWQGALNHCKNIKLAGHEDWRLPNVRELHSIMNYNIEDAATNFDNGNSAYTYPDILGKLPKDATNFFWSSTSLADSEAQKAWTVQFNHAGVNAEEKNSEFIVRAVRGGQ